MSEKVEDCARLQAENDVLRGLVQRNPDWRCTYGLDIDHMVKCPHGFPGCACADDLMAGDDAEWKAMAKERLAFRAERDAAVAEVQRLRETQERARLVVWQCWRELNEIRARDGVPYTHTGSKSGVAEEWFSKVVDDAGDWLGPDGRTPWPPKAARSLVEPAP